MKPFLLLSIGIAIPALASDDSLKKTENIRFNELRKILEEEAMQITGNCFADEKTESTLGEYDNSNQQQHYGEFGNPRD